MHENDEELVLAVLTALPEVGTIAALPFVKRHTKRRGSPRVQEAAQLCYTALAALADITNNSDTLLRASSAPSQSDTLLRAVSTTANVQSETLLRPNFPSATDSEII